MQITSSGQRLATTKLLLIKLFITVLRNKTEWLIRKAQHKLAISKFSEAYQLKHLNFKASVCAETFRFCFCGLQVVVTQCRREIKHKTSSEFDRQTVLSKQSFFHH